MWSIEHHLGRLVEIRLASPIVLAEVAAFEQRIKEVALELHRRGLRAVSCTDVRTANVLAPDVAEAFIKVMQRDNAILERSAFLCGPSAMFALQLERMVKEAQSPLRRAFREAEPLQEWLGELLTPVERARLQRYLTTK